MLIESVKGHFMPAKVSVLVRSAMIALDELRREFGLLTALNILGEVGRRNAMGLPFKVLPPPADAREKETRDELVPAVNLYQTLLARVDPERAFQIARRVILNSSLLHLRSIYPDFGGRNFLNLADGDAEKAAARLGADFAFADTQVLEMTKEKASFDVIKCRIPDVLAQVDATRLAGIFCEVDFIYFPIFEPDVHLERNQTIIRGGSVCDFRLSWKKLDV